MNVGSYSVKSGADVGEVVGKGNLRTLALAFPFDVVQGSGKVGESNPALHFFAPGGVEIGAAWHKRHDAPDGARLFYSITFDDPSFDKPLNVAAWPVDGKPDAFNIVFSRPKQPKQG